MVRLVSEGADVVALQEVPLWALGRLEAWSGMRAFTAVTKLPLLGPLARRLQELDPARVRSPLTGQANAILVGSRLGQAGGSRRTVLRRRSLRRERRVCQLVPVDADGEPLLLVNVHTTSHADRTYARAEIERVGRLVAGAGPCIVCGDFNVAATGLPGFSPPIAGIDQILVRGLAFEQQPEPWPEERRRLGERLLSDHAPVEAVVA
jgi:endonuclease/exonuclease/phosphatase (EEP) superfamily protein YafD